MALKRGGWSVGCLKILPAWIEFCRVQEPCRNMSVMELAVPGRTWSRSKAPHGILCFSCVPALEICHPVWHPRYTESLLLLLLPQQCWLTGQPPVCCPLFASLRAAAVPYSSFGGSRSCSLAASLGRECPGGAVLILCHLVNLIQCLTSAPKSSTEAVSFLLL